MPEPDQNRIMQSLGQAETLYHRLVLLVGVGGSGKTTALRAVAGELGTEVINVNLALSARLIELTGRQRTLHLSTLFGGVVEEAGTVALLDNIEILFDHGLRQDPLRLLQVLPSAFLFCERRRTCRECARQSPRARIGRKIGGR